MTPASQGRDALGRKHPEPEVLLAGPETLVAGPVVVIPGRYEVHLRGREIPLTAKELELLVFLIRKQGSVASSDEISRAVWHRPQSTNTVTVHGKRLRAKLGDDPHDGVIIRTVRGVGYRIAPSLCEP